MRIVLDTNIWLSGLFWEGEANKIIKLGEKGRIKIIISKEIISEIIDVLNKETKFQKFLENRDEKIEDMIRTILFITDLVYLKTKINIIKEHSADNMILETALDGKAKYIVSYNNHLLNLRQFKNIKIIKPDEFLEIFK